MLFEERPFEIGKGQVLREGSDVTIISTGSTTLDALEAVEILRKSGISAELIGMPTVWPLDRELVLQSAKKTGKVVTVEEHYVSGGLGTIVSESLSEEPNIIVRRLGMPNAYAITCGDYRKLLSYYRLDGQGISDQVNEFLKNS